MSTPVSLDQPSSAPESAAPQERAVSIPDVAKREFTARAVVISVLVSAFIGASYPYVVLKLGFGPNISVVSAFFGYLGVGLIGAVTRSKGTRWEANVVQTAGTAAGQSAFMCILLAAFDMLNQKKELGFNIQINWVQTFLWLTVAGLLGVLLAVPFRKHYIDEEDLVYADGMAAGVTLMVIDADKKEAGKRSKALGLGLLLSLLFAWFREDGGMGKLIKGVQFQASWFWGQYGHAMKMGVDWSLLSFGSGLLVGLRISISMAIGMLLSWVILPPYLMGNGYIQEETFAATLRWVMWPATGLMVAGGFTSLILKWRLIVKTFARLRSESVGGSDGDIPIKFIGIGVVVLTVALCVLQYFSLGMPLWLSFIAILLSIPLMLVGLRVLGETNWAPISALANLMQAVFALISPGNIAANMILSGMSGTVGVNGETLMQCYRSGKIVGSTNRYLTYIQFLGVPIGALTLAFVYPILRDTYGIGGESGLSSPISVKWAGFAELLMGGFDKLPQGCFTAMLAALILGCVIAALEPKFGKYLPSPTGIGIGMLIPGFVMMPMVLGGFAQWLWQKADAKHEDAYNTPFASGLIAGEAIIAVVLPLLIVFGLMSP
jgi:putative OPT family oligopeptide transporter